MGHSGFYLTVSITTLVKSSGISAENILFMKLINYAPCDFEIFLITCGCLMTCGISMSINDCD